MIVLAHVVAAVFLATVAGILVMARRGNNFARNVVAIAGITLAFLLPAPAAVAVAWSFWTVGRWWGLWG